ncbi:MAG: DUF4350 domain-containing protein [Bacteroidota bacterium]
MKKNTVIVIIVALVATAAIVYFTVVNLGSDKKGTYIWEPTFNEGTKQPYDFGLIQKLVQNGTTGNFKIVDSKLSPDLKDQQESDSTGYLFIGQYCYLNTEEIEELLKFAYSGHQVFIVAEQVPDTLLEVLQFYGKPFRIDNFFLPDVHTTLNNTSTPYDSFHFRYRHFEQKFDHSVNWNYISEEKQLSYYYEDVASRYLELGRINGKLNFAKFKHGQGEIYLHTNPLLFTNYFLLSDSGFAHANYVFSELQTKNILYDIGSRNYKPDSKKIATKSKSALSYILSKPALKWAWYLLLTAIVLFFLFKAKREQRVITVIEKRRNSTLSFIDTIAGLYFNHKDHKQMAVIKMQLFTGFIRHKLGLSTTDLSAENIAMIASKANVPLQHTSIIFEYYEQVIKANTEIHDIDLINFNQYIETFYQYYNAKK